MNNVKHQKYLGILFKLAQDVAPIASARIAAAVVYRNEIISFGTNQMKSHPFQNRFSKNSKSIFLHAETDAIKNALKHLDKDDLSKCTLYICRAKYDMENRNFIFGLSRPCVGCMRAIATFDIRKCVFSCDDGGYDTL
jgi:hypothetical protein